MTQTDPALIARVEALLIRDSTGREISSNWAQTADLRALLTRIRELEAERDAARAILTDKGRLSMTAEERLSAWLDGYRDNDQIPVDLFHDIKRARDALRSLASAPTEGDADV